MSPVLSGRPINDFAVICLGARMRRRQICGFIYPGVKDSEGVLGYNGPGRAFYIPSENDGCSVAKVELVNQGNECTGRSWILQDEAIALVSQLLSIFTMARRIEPCSSNRQWMCAPPRGRRVRTHTWDLAYHSAANGLGE